MDIEVAKISKITHISEVTLWRIFKQIRNLIAKECEKTSKMQGEIEIDENYFGAKRVRGKRGRGAGKKTPVFGMLKRNGRVYTQIVKGCSASELLPILRDSSNLAEL